MEKYIITHSSKGFDHKPKGKDYNCNFIEEKLSIYEIGQLIKQNYIFTPNLLNIENGRKKNNIRSYSYIPFDFDKIEIKWYDFYQIVNKLEYQPTFVYCTSSWNDNENKNNFRLIYIMNKELSYAEYQQIYNQILDSFKKVLPSIVDEAMKRANQCIAGTIHSSTVIQKGNITLIENFKINLTQYNQFIEKQFVFNNTKSNKESQFSKEEKLLLQNYKIFEYVNKFKENYTPIENNFAYFDCPVIQRIDYVEINYFYKKKLKDGQRRKRFLYEEVMKMRLIKPNADKYELLWNLCNVANEDCDLNGLGMFHMVQIVDSALNTNIDEWNKQRIEQQSKYIAHKYKSDFTVNTYYCKLHNLDWREERSKYIKMLKDMKKDIQPKKEKTSDKIARMYIPTISNRENAKRIGVSEGTIRNWLKTVNRG